MNAGCVAPMRDCQTQRWGRAGAGLAGVNFSSSHSTPCSSEWVCLCREQAWALAERRVWVHESPPRTDSPHCSTFASQRRAHR